MSGGTAVKTKQRVYRCAICDVELRDQRWVYSPTTGARFCPPDEWDACEARSLTKGAK